MPISLILIGVLAAGYPLVYASFVVREKIVVSGVRKVERDAGVVACNARVGTIEAGINEAVRKGIADARKAGDLINATPEDKTELIRLCNASASCRSRGAF